ncbi:MAG: alpha-galactosidase [Victivallales bacterium]
MKKEMQSKDKWVGKHLLQAGHIPSVTDMAAHIGLPFTFVYNGMASGELLDSWPKKTEKIDLDGKRTRHTLVWKDPKTGLEVRCAAIDYADYPSVDWVVYLKNTGLIDTPILENIQALDASWQQEPVRPLIVHHAKGSDSAPSDFAPLSDTIAPGGELKMHSHGSRYANRGGLPSIESLPFFNLQLGDHGMIAGLGWSGAWSAGFARDAGGTVNVRAGLEHTRLLLHPGEEIRGPRIVMLFWQGDRPQAHNLWRRLLLEHYSPRPGGKPFTGLIADLNWGSYMNAGKHVEEINFWHEHGLPMECYWVDAGWADMSLGWEAHTSHTAPDPSLFPDGLKPLADAAHRRGMKFLLWMVPESVHPAVGIGKEHPELLGEPWNPSVGNMIFHGLDHGKQQANQLMIDHFSKLVGDFDVDVFRQDGENLWPEDTVHDREGMSQIGHIDGFYKFWDGLLEKHPDLLIDNCACGGRKIDIETISRSVALWRSDCQAWDFDPVTNQGFNYGLLQWIPLCGGVVLPHKLSTYAFRSAYSPALIMNWPMTGNWITGGDRSTDPKVRWSNIDLDLLRKLLKEYLSIRPYTFGDFYPLTPYSIKHSDWLAWQFDRPDLGEGMVQAFRRPECPETVQQYRLHGLAPEGMYSVVDLDDNRQRDMSGLELMETGLEASISSLPGAKVITYKLHERMI